MLITIETWKSSSNSGQIQNLGIVQQNKRIQFRISLIIVTDFLCWVPFIIVCYLHNVQFIDASDWYVYFAMIVLPIISVINPLLYDKTITDWTVSLFRRFRTFFNSTIVPFAQMICHRQEANEDISLEEVQHNPSQPDCSTPAEVQRVTRVWSINISFPLIDYCYTIDSP